MKISYVVFPTKEESHHVIPPSSEGQQTKKVIVKSVLD